MLSVIGKAFKRRKLASQLSQRETGSTTAPVDQSAQHLNSAHSEINASGSIIRADIFDTAKTSAHPLNDSDTNINMVRDIVFIDGGVPHIGKLLRELDPHAEIHILDLQTDGTEQIATRLAGRDELQILHIFCHGENGILKLGSARVTPDTITTIHSKAFSRIGAALSESSDILIYGCDFCGGTVGRVAATQLAMLTGADVASSSEIFTESDFENDFMGSVEKTPSSTELSPTEINSTKSKISKLSYSVPDGGQLETSAEGGLLHFAGLIGGTLKSATDGSGARIKLHEPGVSGIRPHMLPNGAELTQYTNGAFTYKSETDAGEGELITCLAVGRDHILAKIEVSVNVETSNEIVSGEASQRKTDLEATATETRASSDDPIEPGQNGARKSSPRFPTQLSINVPDTSAGPIAETTTLVDAPLIFLQRNRSAISVSGSNNDMIVLTLTAANGKLCARPLKGAQVDGFNSVTLTIAGSVSQINAALDGLRFINSPNHVGPTELIVSAKYEKGGENTEVTETIAISVKSISLDGKPEETATSAASKQSDEIKSAMKALLATSDDQSALADDSLTGTLEPQNFKPDTPFVAEFTAAIGAVTTIAGAGETMKLKEGDLQISRDGTFSFSLKEGYTKSPSRVSCSIRGQGADPVYPPIIMLNLSRLPLELDEVFSGNVFSSDTLATKLSFEEYEASKKQSLETQADGARENAKEIAADSEGSQPPASLPEEGMELESQPSAEPEEEVTFTEILENEEPILSSAPIVLANEPTTDTYPDLKFDRGTESSDLQFGKWDIEEFSGQSLNFSFDHEGRQVAITPTMRRGQITLDTFKRQQALYLDVNNTFDSQTHGKVTSYHIELKDGSPCPEWILENHKGFFSIEMPSTSDAIELKISAMMQHGLNMQCLVKIYRESGIIEPLPNGETSLGVYQRDESEADFTSGFATA